MSLDTFIRIADSLVQFEADLNDKLFPMSSIHTIEIHKEELKESWQKLKRAYDVCLSDIEADDQKEEEDGEEEKPDLESVRSKYRSAYITYCRCISVLREAVQEVTPQRTENIPSSNQGFTLPPCEIPEFNGDYSAWPTFRDMFHAVCIRNSRLNSVEKLFHLQRRTTGEPNDIVKKFPLTNENFTLAWKTLCSRYENKRVLVNLQLKTLFNLPVISTESGVALKKLQRDMNACMSLLKSYHIEIDSWDPIFLFICCNRLPENTLTLWEQTLSDTSTIPSWSELNTFLTNRHRTLESVLEIRKGSDLSTTSLPKRSHNSAKAHIKSFQNKVEGPKCRLCPNELHIIRKCPRFLNMNPHQRLTEIKNSNLCINCFSKLHTVKKCTSKFSCFKCKKRHNTLLHREIENFKSGQSSTSTNSNTNEAQFSPNSIPNQIQSTTSKENSAIKTYFATNSRGVLLGTALVLIYHNGMAYKARALIDSGSEGSFISDKLFNRLKIPFKKTCVKISGLNNTVSAASQKKCTLIFGSTIFAKIEIPATVLVVPQLSSCLPSSSIDLAVFSNLPNIPLADPSFYQSSNIDILLGGDIIPSIMLDGIKRPICGSLMAQETVFGWILTGPVSVQPPSSIPTTISYFCEISLDKKISRFWEMEDLPRGKFLSPSDTFCEELYIRTTKRNQEGRYIVSLPFKEGYPDKLNIGHSRNKAMSQFIRNEARLIRTPEFKLEYDNVLSEYLPLGHMSKVACPTFEKTTNYFYLPHHAVIKPDSKTTRVRVVFNASSPSSNGLSLNDVLYTGPVLQNDLSALIIKWRLFRYVFNGDITKMYRQILINPEQTAFQRILFRKNPNEPIHNFELSTVTFGFNCAPYLAIRTLLRLADDIQSVYPLASDILRNWMYVDDALVGSHSVPRLVEIRNQLTSALKSAGFSMCKWTSNSKKFLEDLPTKDLLREDFLEFEDSSIAKTLGIRWNASLDSFLFSLKPFPEHCRFTKREVLSQISSLFDPVGWLAPCIITAKIIMQNIWMDGTDWDSVISASSLVKWKIFQTNYSFLNAIKIPRWINYTLSSEVEFHAFCDASENAYAAAVYIRVQNSNIYNVHLISSKTRVAPIKTQSIPRLELCGAVILAEMVDKILSNLPIKKYSLYCWTDSTIVLSWLAKPACYWSTFVANRVSKITQVINPSNWHHVNTESNPADLASRGISPHELIDNDLWWHGPHWLKEPSINWPNTNSIPFETIETERKPIRVNFSYFQKFGDILERFSSLPRAFRVVAYIYRFFRRTHPSFRDNFNRASIEISAAEVLMVRNKIISICQKAYYPDEYRTLSAKMPIARSSTILNLNPFIDSEGILRVSGRLISSPILSYDEKHPIILPYFCQYSRLLIYFIHQISLHGGNQLVLRLVRTQYWIPRVKNLIKSTINKCKPCILYKRKCQSQLMAALPPERSGFSRPFTHTGLDFAGPFDIKSYIGRACRITKGYVCVFVCFTTKAIHLEATSDLSTPTFLAAFSRFVSRRGCPLHLHSDNGTTFVGASKVLAKEYLKTSRQAILSNNAHQNITWNFIPLGAPHMGGLWEAGVKSFKIHLRKIAGNIKYTFEEFQNLLSKIEACLNSRPLTPATQDPSDLAAITPGHFLVGSPLLTPIEPDIREASQSIVNRWQRLKLIHQHLCNRWKSEYLKELHKRHKWKNPTENLTENMMVVVKDENLPPNSWRLGRISKVYYGRVRVADIYTEKGSITRPVTKLVILSST